MACRLGPLMRALGPKAVALASVLPAAARAVAADAAAGPVTLLPWTLGVAALLLVTVLGAMLGALWARQHHRRALQDARSQALARAQWLAGWQWQTDAHHHVVDLQPPAGGGRADWAEQARGQPLWQCLLARDNDALPLRARLDARLALVDVPVHPADEPGAAWSLRGVPRFDDAGHFIGYLGLAEPRDEQRACHADRAALEVLMRALPGPLWLAERSPIDGEFRVRRSNAAANRLCADVGTQPAWPTLLSRLPDGLKAAVTGLEPGQSALQDGWSVHLEALPGSRDSAEGRMLALLPAPDARVPEAVPNADHESFVYMVSHDLRAPIRVIEGFARILKEDYGRLLDRIGNDHLDRVLSASARMQSMIDALLDLSRLSNQPLVRQPVNLSQLAGFVVDDLRRHQPERTVRVHIRPAMVAQGDPTLLRLVLENLLGNAWKYSARAAHAEIAFETVEHEGQTAFMVRDNGAGFDMRFADRLFGVFQRLHGANDFPGTGVGLASVKRIVSRHGGRVWADSEVGKGARFYFTLQA